MSSQIAIQKKKLSESTQRIINILRTTTAPQIENAYFDNKGGMCAMGALRFGFGICDKFGNLDHKGSWCEYMDAIRQMKNDCNQLPELIIMNDDYKMTFGQIADEIERVATCQQ